MNNLEFVQLSKPKGRAYANNSVVSARENVKALSIQRTIDKFQLYNDSLYPINDNFPLSTWETRFNITPLDGQTIEERTAVVKKKMDFPKGQTSRLSLDYIQSQLDYFGFSAATVYYNEEGDTTGYIHGNNYTASEKYTTGLNKYNSFVVDGKMDSQDDYIRMLRLLVSLKPLDCFIVDRAYYQTVLAIDATTILAVNGTQALLLNSNSNIYKAGNIVFEDDEVKRIMVANFDTTGDGEISYAEAAAVVVFPNELFFSNLAIVSFDELQYFINTTSIGYNCFSNCQRLASVILPESLTSLTGKMFTNSAPLSHLIIPQGVTTISSYSFGSCSSLIDVIFEGVITLFPSKVFSATSSSILLPNTPIPPLLAYNSLTYYTGNVYVPDASLAAYKAATYWSNIASRIFALSDYTG